ncbi:MAG: cell envelope integrity protein CreD [Synergistaceae bacterium]|jgi:inner membrane protein|nr:cell envelope integrity protein CreD [Synergistaceae bacterium]
MLVFNVIFFIFVSVILLAAGATALWICFRYMTPEGEDTPKWGDLRPLKRLNLLRSSSLTPRMIVAAIVAALTVIPITFVNDLVNERYQRYINVIDGISYSWGGAQTFAGPVISVPYTERYQESEQIPLTDAELFIERSRSGDRSSREIVRTVEKQRVAIVLPEELYIDGDVKTEPRKRGIYSTQVYTAGLAVSGVFIKPDLTALGRHVAEVHWDEATVAVGLSSTKAIREASEMELAGEKLKFLPGTGGNKALPTGFSTQCDLSSIPADGRIDFNFQVSVGGSMRLFLTPLGVVSRFRLKSGWPHPNFTGAGLPESREITPLGFSAEWNIPNLVRNYPQFGDMESWSAVPAADNDFVFAGETIAQYGNNLAEYVTGVEFFEPVFHYSLLLRAVKYAVLFIAMTFLGVVIFENYSGRRNNIRFNIIQYCVIGLGLSIFYLTLLAVSEHLDFTKAYFLAAAINVAMIGGYVAAALKRYRPALMIALVQALLYTLLFFILRMEDYALLAGTAILIVGTAALMAATRNVNQPHDARDGGNGAPRSD